MRPSCPRSEAKQPSIGVVIQTTKVYRQSYFWALAVLCITAAVLNTLDCGTALREMSIPFIEGNDTNHGTWLRRRECHNAVNTPDLACAFEETMTNFVLSSRTLSNRPLSESDRLDRSGNISASTRFLLISTILANKDGVEANGRWPEGLFFEC